MAEGKKLPDNLENSENLLNGDDTNYEETQSTLQLDLGDDLSHTSETNRLGGSTSASNSGITNDFHKREDNPFSFKHFLRSDANNYQNKGARPKVFMEGRPVTVSDGDETKQSSRIIPEYSSALPDFVQDHIVVEQQYLSNNSNNNFKFDINLPDFTPVRSNCNINNRMNHESSPDYNQRDDTSVSLDLPFRRQAAFPLDLPISESTPTQTLRNGNSEVGVSKSLPDFLADGAVHTQQSDIPLVESPERECERLRRELDITRQQLAESNIRVENLTKELEIARNKEHEYTRKLTKALEQVEDNLQRSNAEVQRLRKENRTLRGEEGAAGGCSSSSMSGGARGYEFYSANEIIHSQRLAQELKTAANTAEHSLRQLLNGVDNLRMMASTLENLHRIEETREPFFDLDEGTGPAL